MTENIVGSEINSSDEPLRIRTWQETISKDEHKKPIQERIDAMTYIKPFPIKEVDLLTVKRFIQWCRFNSKNDWGIGLKMLLDFVDADAKVMMLYHKQIELEHKIEKIEIILQQPQEEKNEKDEKKRRGFGGDKK